MDKESAKGMEPTIPPTPTLTRDDYEILAWWLDYSKSAWEQFGGTRRGEMWGLMWKLLLIIDGSEMWGAITHDGTQIPVERLKTRPNMSQKRQ